MDIALSPTTSRFMRTKLSFTSIGELSQQDSLKLLKIRNEPTVRKNMYTDHLISEQEHFEWVSRIKLNNQSEFYAVFRDEELVGGAGVSSINLLHRRGDWAFYLSENCRGAGVGSALEYQFVTKIFSEFQIEKLNCEVISFNNKVVSLHQKFGFSIEGVRRNHVIRDGQVHDAILLGITRQEWEDRWGSPSSPTHPK